MQARSGWTVIFVTLSVFESVFLSDRIVVMAARPGRVIEELHVDAPDPRSEEFRTSAESAAHCRAASSSATADLPAPGGSQTAVMLRCVRPRSTIRATRSSTEISCGAVTTVLAPLLPPAL